MKSRSTRLHLLTTLALLLGWGQQLCAEVGMACLDVAENTVVSASEDMENGEHTSCHESPDTEPVPAPEQQPMMACCQTTDAVVSSAAIKVPELDADRTLGTSPSRSKLRPPSVGRWIPAPPPDISPDLLQEQCRLII